jgi:hypothetical protein
MNDSKVERSSVYQVNQSTYEKPLSFAVYTIGSATFWGQFLLVFFLGTGLVAIPLDFITTWADRPIPMTESQFKKEKDMLSKQVDYLLKEGKKIYEDKLKLDA